MKRLLISAAAGALALAALPASAQDNPSSVEEVVVTATRLPMRLDLAPGARVIDEKDIAARGAVYATDILDGVPGLSVFENGAFGGVASVRMRGMASDKTLVLVDGVPLNDPSQPNGSFDFSNFDLADVKRIEILSGPQASLWGSDAIGGVIAFTTRDPEGLSASVEGGSYGTVRGTLSGGVSDDAYAYGFSLAGLRTDGVSRAAVGTERDGDESRSAGLNGRARLTDAVTLDGKIRWQSSRTEVDGYVFVPPFSFLLGDTPEVAKSESWSGYARLTAAGPWGFRHQASVSLYDIDRSQFGGDFPFAYSADRRVWRWTAERNGDERWGATFGAERADTNAQLSDGSDKDLGTTSAFAVARVRPLARLTATFSLRHDAPDDVKSATTGRAAAVYQLGGGFDLQASWGQGFKTPTISQLACDFCFPAGSADLKPEHARGWDVGLRWRSDDGRYTASVTGYQLDVRDQITFVTDPVSFATRYENVQRVRSRGAEAEGSAELGAGFSVSGSYSYTDAKDLGTGLQELRVPKHQGSATVAWADEKRRAALTLRAESEQADAGDFGRAEREGFVVADFNGGWKLTDHVEATLKVRNLTDRDYQEVLGYREVGRSAWIGLRLRY
jgi:vitamin B12 transporter